VTMMPVTARGKGDQERGCGDAPEHRPSQRQGKGTFQTFEKEVCITCHLKYPGSCTILQENVFCECCTRFGGCLPVPKAKALLPYWVPLSMRPQNQTSKVVLLYVPKANMTCPCLCHCFGGRLPMPRDQAVMPYWVPQGLRPQKVVKRRESANGIQECPLDLSCWCGHWRVFGAQCFFLKRQQLQAFHED
uniref:RIKEN cDNA 1700018B08 gene n=1 Tax=Jaculus jaculus TaxID=51337 RepID=A0A8C5P575_JACJA